MQSDRHWFNFNKKISKILSGDKESNKKTYIKYKYTNKIELNFICFFFVDFCIPVFYALKMVVFVPRSARGT